VYLIGDSHAGHFSESWQAAARMLGQPLTIATTNGCPLIEMRIHSSLPGSHDRQCREYVAAVLSYLSRARPGIVVVSNSTAYWYNSAYQAAFASQPLTSDPAAKAQQFALALDATVADLRRMGHRVILTQAVPHWFGDDEWDPRLCSTADIIRGHCTKSQSWSSYLAGSSAIRRSVSAVAAKDHATVWDPSLAMCSEGVCSTSGNGFIRFRDGSHISVAQAIELGGSATTSLANADSLAVSEALRSRG
jgi:hypothetical protein